MDVHTSKTSIPVTTSTSGNNIIVANIPDTWIYIHELIGSFDGTADTLTVKAGTRVLATFPLLANQGLTEQDEPGNDGVARFTCRPGEDFILDSVGGTPFVGSCDYSTRT